MEDVLEIYEREYDPRYPAVCFDERPCVLRADVEEPIPMKTGRKKRYDFHYERNGTCVLLAAFEHLKGQRYVETRQQRTKKDYAEFMKALADRYPDAEKIIVVQDNLNTHNPSSFYERFSAEEAFELTQKFEFHYTPKKASWLNMIEIELSAISRHCLNRRIKSMDLLNSEVQALVKERNEKQATVDWQFTKSKARSKFGRQYAAIKN